MRCIKEAANSSSASGIAPLGTIYTVTLKAPVSPPEFSCLLPRLSHETQF